MQDQPKSKLVNSLEVTWYGVRSKIFLVIVTISNNDLTYVVGGFMLHCCGTGVNL